MTDVNEPPVFESETYSFSVAEDAAVWSTVGRMTATDPDAGDTSAGTVFFHITAGNEAGKFAYQHRHGRGGDPRAGRTGLRDDIFLHADGGGPGREGERHVVGDGRDQRD